MTLRGSALEYWAGISVQAVKNLSAIQETSVWSLGWKNPLEKEMVTHPSILAWKVPWTEKSGGGSQRGKHLLYQLYLQVLPLFPWRDLIPPKNCLLVLSKFGTWKAPELIYCYRHIKAYIYAQSNSLWRKFRNWYQIQSLCPDTELNLWDRVLCEVEKNSFIALLGKGGHSGLMFSRLCDSLWRV